MTRIDQLISDTNDEHWIVEHRVALDDYASDASLIEDDEQQRAIWAIETSYPQLLVSGTIYNELLVNAGDPDRFAEPGPLPSDPDVDARTRGVRETRDMSRVRHPSGAAARQPVSPDPEEIAMRSVEVDRVDLRSGTDGLRRSVVRRSRESIAAAGRRVAIDVARMIDPDVDVAPSPSPERCPSCAFLAPCTSMQAGRDAEFTLLTEFRRRGDEELEDAGLRRPDERREQQGWHFAQDEHANLRWS